VDWDDDEEEEEASNPAMMPNRNAKSKSRTRGRWGGGACLCSLLPYTCSFVSVRAQSISSRAASASSSSSSCCCWWWSLSPALFGGGDHLGLGLEDPTAPPYIYPCLSSCPAGLPPYLPASHRLGHGGGVHAGPAGRQGKGVAKAVVPPKKTRAERGPWKR
jgi:hypothetical protein